MSRDKKKIKHASSICKQLWSTHSGAFYHKQSSWSLNCYQVIPIPFLTTCVCYSPESWLRGYFCYSIVTNKGLYHSYVCYCMNTEMIYGYLAFFQKMSEDCEKKNSFLGHMCMISLMINMAASSLESKETFFFLHLFFGVGGGGDLLQVNHLLWRLKTN